MAKLSADHRLNRHERRKLKALDRAESPLKFAKSFFPSRYPHYPKADAAHILELMVPGEKLARGFLETVFVADPDKVCIYPLLAFKPGGIALVDATEVPEDFVSEFLQPETFARYLFPLLGLEKITYGEIADLFRAELDSNLMLLTCLSSMLLNAVANESEEEKKDRDVHVDFLVYDLRRRFNGVLAANGERGTLH